MKIKMITLYAGPAGVMQAGETHEVEPKLANDLIAGKYAVAVKASAPVETASLVIDETVETSVPVDRPITAEDKAFAKGKGKKDKAAEGSVEDEAKG